MTGRRQVTAHALVRVLGDWRQAPGPLYERLARRIGQMLADGRLAPEARLPAERPLAEALGVSRSTVVRAYGLLRDQGLLESRRGAGSITRLNGATVERFAPWSPGSRLGRPPPAMVDLSKAAPAAGRETVRALQRAAEGIEGLIEDDGYHPRGLASLRAAIAARYEARGAPTSPEQILVTAGAQQAIDLLVRTLVRRREAVLLEAPTYPGAIDSLRHARARMVSLDLSAEPWDLGAVSALISQTDARLAYVIPDFQNPTAHLMPNHQRAELVRLCRQHGVTLIVDETLAEVALEPHESTQPMAAHDPSEGLISIGSLSKVAWGGLRIGWIRASRRQVTAFAAMRTTADLGGPLLEQMAARELLANLDRCLAERLPALRQQRDALVSTVRALGWKLTVPHGGLSVWVRLPYGSSSLLADVAYHQGVLLTPGPRLSPDGALDRYLRLPFTLPVAQIQAAIGRLGRAWEVPDDLAQGARIPQAV